MPYRAAWPACALFTIVSLHAVPGAQAPLRRAATPSPAPSCGDVVSFQVLLDRQGFSPGQIDGKAGTNLSRAVSAMQTARGLPSSGGHDCAAWRALAGVGEEPAIRTYTVTIADMKGPFERRIPAGLAQQAALATLGYQSVEEELAERFHASPALLRQLNRGVRMLAGQEVRVPAVTPFTLDDRPPDADADGASILVSRDDSALRVLGSDGAVLFYAPVTTGSVHDPLPPGKYKALGLRWLPVFRYNPLLFWDAAEGADKATIKAGPNNPVGVVWIALDLEHYGIHGTPEPGRVGHTESHGCVRLTNWDAARVTTFVKPGTTVEFR